MAGAAGNQVRALFEPHVAALDHAFFEAFSLAVGQTLLIGVATGIVALVVSLFMRELPLRTTFGPEPTATHVPDGAEADESRETGRPMVGREARATD
jgi:hypothetical protein